MILYRLRWPAISKSAKRLDGLLDQWAVGVPPKIQPARAPPRSDFTSIHIHALVTSLGYTGLAYTGLGYTGLGYHRNIGYHIHIQYIIHALDTRTRAYQPNLSNQIQPKGLHLNEEIHAHLHENMM